MAKSRAGKTNDLEEGAGRAAQSGPIVGDNGDNRLQGGDGDDVIRGRGGDDTIIGGRGTDTMTGGSGADTFFYRTAKEGPLKNGGVDVITDFEVGVDVIDLSSIDANPLNGPGDDAFEFRGEDNGSNRPGQLWYEYRKGDTYVFGDFDANQAAEVRFRIEGKVRLTEDDFLL